MELKVTVIKNALFNAAGELGKASEEFRNHATRLYMHEADIEKLGVKEGDRVDCTLLPGNHSFTMVATPYRFIAEGTVALNPSAFLPCRITSGATLQVKKGTGDIPTFQETRDSYLAH